VGHGDKLSRNLEQAISALLSAPSIREAATICGVSEKTLDAWLKRPDFRAAYRKARADVLEGVVAWLRRAAVQAVAALVGNLSAPRPGDRTRAGELILQYTFRGAELTDVLTRLEQVEASVRDLDARRDDPAAGASANGHAGRHSFGG
jgi:hypothetical protein